MQEPAFVFARPGQLVAGRYRIERLLARGGHGAVFVAEQLATEARVALKLLLPHVLDSQEARDRFALEARIAGRVSSEFIVRVLDAGVDETSGLPYLAMELLTGESLADAVAHHGPMSLVDASTYLLQVAQGLDRAHNCQSRAGKPAPIIHRDLKPENLFLSVREDGQRVAKVLDFGVAKVMSDSVVRSRAINGSPLYMAYEQLTAGPLSPRTDIWAFGLIAFFTLTGKPYWRAAAAPDAGMSAVFAEILHMPIVEPSTRAAELGLPVAWPRAFDAWFLRCVDRDPQARFASAGEAARALLHALLAEDLEASVSERAADGALATVAVEDTPRSRSRAPLWIAGASLLGVAIGYGVMSSRTEPLERSADAAVRSIPPRPARAVTPALETNAELEAAAVLTGSDARPPAEQAGPATSASAATPSAALSVQPQPSARKRVRRARPRPEDTRSILNSRIYNER